MPKDEKSKKLVVLMLNAPCATNKKVANPQVHYMIFCYRLFNLTPNLDTFIILGVLLFERFNLSLDCMNEGDQDKVF